jgi:hypothetical protein
LVGLSASRALLLGCHEHIERTPRLRRAPHLGGSRTVEISHAVLCSKLKLSTCLLVRRRV